MALRFRARLGGEEHLCLISYEALRVEFGGCEPTTFLSFEKHRDAILARAAKLRGRKKAPKDGRLSIAILPVRLD